MNIVKVIVDMQNDFVHPEGKLYMGTQVEDLPVKIGEYINKTPMETTIIATMDMHNKDDVEFARFPEHCLSNTPGSLLHPSVDLALLKHGNNMSYCTKKTFSSPSLLRKLRVLIDDPMGWEIEFSGVCTSICVAANVMMAHQYFNRYRHAPKISIRTDLVADICCKQEAAMLNLLDTAYGIELKDGGY